MNTRNVFIYSITAQILDKKIISENELIDLLKKNQVSQFTFDLLLKRLREENEKL